MRVLAACNDRITQDQAIRANLCGCSADRIIYQLIVPEYAETAGQMARSGRTAHDDLCRIDLPLCRVFPDIGNRFPKLSHRGWEMVRGNAVVENKGMASHGHKLKRQGLTLPIRSLPVSASGTDDHSRPLSVRRHTHFFYQISGEQRWSCQLPRNYNFFFLCIHDDFPLCHSILFIC